MNLNIIVDIPRPLGRGDDMFRRPLPGLLPKDAAIRIYALFIQSKAWPWTSINWESMRRSFPIYVLFEKSEKCTML